jgi:PAS domain S-box-containing protein
LVQTGVIVFLLLRLKQAGQHNTQVLQEKEQRFRDMAQLLPQTVYEADLNGNMIFVNRKGLETFNYPEETLVKGINLLTTIAPEDQDRAKKRIGAMLRDDYDGTQGTRYQMIKHTGERFPALIYAVPFKKDGFLKGHRGIVVDISEQESHQKALENSEATLRTLFDNAADALLIMDETLKIIDVNHTMLKMFDISKQDALASSIIHDLSAPANNFNKLSEATDRVKMGRSYRFEWRAKRASDNMEFDVEITLNRVFMNSSQLLLANVRDISARKKTERQNEQRNKEIRRFNQIAMDREKRVLELKLEVNQLSKALDKKPPYRVSSIDVEE